MAGQPISISPPSRTLLPLTLSVCVRRPLLERCQGGLANDRLQVGTAVPVSLVSDFVECDVRCPGGFDGQPPQNVLAAVDVGQRHVQDLVQPSWSKHGWVDEVGTIGGCDDVHLTTFQDAVHLCEQLIHHPLARRRAFSRSLGAQRVQLVEEDDARRRHPRPLEHLTHSLLALAHILVEQLGALDGDQVGPALLGHRLGQQCLAAAGGPVQQHACGDVETEPVEDLWPADGLADGEGELLFERLESADLFPCNVGDGGESLPSGGRLHALYRVLEVLFLDGE
mmetsp:Transcript_52418/g.131772  ORF Transcript_52418/g.131772 Transcript_52418/m.131772 type:complete len:282 (-) Transcript_52418:678-1523(-)